MRTAIIGGGVVGLSATYCLAAKGHEVECFEESRPMGRRSVGATRIFRLAHGTPTLVDLAGAARGAFAQWASALGRPLIGPEGLVVTGPDVKPWASAMAEAGVDAETDDHVRAEWNVCRAPGWENGEPILFDPGAGVLDAAGVAQFLLARVGHRLRQAKVVAAEIRGNSVHLRTEAGGQDYDAVVIAAGEQTSALGAQIGLSVPDASAHHARFSFPLAKPHVARACLIDKSEKWRPGITTYEHMTDEGQWAVGVHAPPSVVQSGRSQEEAVADLREIARSHVAENVAGVLAAPTSEVACSISSSWGDGYEIVRNGPVLAIYGDNLFKFAPVLGQELAEAVIQGRPPRSMMDRSSI